MEQFDPKDTKEADFTISPGNIVKVQMMQTDSPFNYTETDQFQLLEMPYEHSSNTSVSMIIILPKDAGPASWDTALDAPKLTAMENNLSHTRVEVYVPKFTMETRYSLSESLGAMGMPTAFNEKKADFSGMDGTKNLSISEVIHKAYVTVDEEGTEAAAATAVIIEATAVKPPDPVFRADHPFLFVIQEKESGNILFMGRVMNPNT